MLVWLHWTHAPVKPLYLKDHYIIITDWVIKYVLHLALCYTWHWSIHFIRQANDKMYYYYWLIFIYLYHQGCGYCYTTKSSCLAKIYYFIGSIMYISDWISPFIFTLNMFSGLPWTVFSSFTCGCGVRVCATVLVSVLNRHLTRRSQFHFSCWLYQCLLHAWLQIHTSACTHTHKTTHISLTHSREGTWHVTAFTCKHRNSHRHTLFEHKVFWTQTGWINVIY